MKIYVPRDAAARAHAEEVWRLPPGTLGAQPGLTVVEIINAAYDRQIRAMLIQGENPAMSDPDAAHAREALAGLSHLVVQDIFLTETASLADVVLPATAWPEKTGSVTNTDRCVQLGRKAVPAPGAFWPGTSTTTAGSNGEDGPSGTPSSPGTGGGGGGASARSRRLTAAISSAATMTMIRATVRPLPSSSNSSGRKGRVRPRSWLIGQTSALGMLAV